MNDRLDSSDKVVASIDRAMNTLCLARAAARVIPARVIGSPLQRRGYADAVSDKIQLTLALPHQVRLACLTLERRCLKLNVKLMLINRKSIFKSTDVYVVAGLADLLTTTLPGN